MATDAILSLNDLICLKESDGTGHSEPYIWPVLVWIDDSFEVHLAAPALGNARVVIKNDMRAGETAALPASVGVLRFRFEDAANIRGMILGAALWEEDESPGDAVRAGFQAFNSEIRAAIADNLGGLANEDDREATIEIINARVRARVESSIRGALTTGEKIRIAAGTLNLDDVVGSDFKNLPDLASAPISLTFAGDTGGRLLFYRDTTLDGSLHLAAPSVIGLGGWQEFKFLFAGDNGAIYAVDQAGQLLFYRDTTLDGSLHLAAPSVIGLGGWQEFKFLFAGDNGAIYAVDQLTTASEGYVIQGELTVAPVQTDPCQAEVDRLRIAQEGVDAVNAEIEALQAELQTASPSGKPGLIADIARLRQQELPRASAALDDARRALKSCRG